MIDKERKIKNDRTWCFWEKEAGFFEDIVYRRWSKLSFLSEEFSSVMDITPYQYKMIRGVDFYDYCFKEIQRYDNIEVVYGNLKEIRKHREGTTIILDEKQYYLDYATIFNSIHYLQNDQPGEIKLLQHFKGWNIRSEKSFFKPGEIVLMDFRVPQDHGTTFAYLLPSSETEALVEYTLFSKNVLEPQQYDEELKSYVRNYLKLDNYAILETEFGIIPMTNKRFKFDGSGVLNIGTAGGQTKASSGYTFQFIQKHSEQIADYLVNGKSPYLVPDTPKRFRFYDNTLLDILYYNKLPGKKIFTRLFQKNKPQDVLRFLDNETSLKDELKIISSLPIWPFLKAAFRQL